MRKSILYIVLATLIFTTFSICCSAVERPETTAPILPDTPAPIDVDYIEPDPSANGFTVYFGDSDFAHFYRSESTKSEDAKVCNCMGRLSGSYLINAGVYNLQSYRSSYRGTGYATNCQTCTAVFHARMKGYDIRALPNDNGRVWHIINNTGQYYIKDNGSTDRMYNHHISSSTYDCINNHVKEGEYYELCVAWVSGGAHSIVCGRENGLLYIYDGQRPYPERCLWVGEQEITDYLEFTKCTAVYPTLMRIDDKAINWKKLSQTTEPADFGRSWQILLKVMHDDGF